MVVTASTGCGERGETGDHGYCNGCPRRPAHASSSTWPTPIRSLRSPGCTDFVPHTCTQGCEDWVRRIQLATSGYPVMAAVTRTAKGKQDVDA